MDRKQVKEILPILVAFDKGKTIETRRKPTADNNGVTKDGWYEFNDWTEMKELEYWVNVDYRIKPEPNYRPFKDAEECWQEMLKHQPFGWIKCKEGYFSIVYVNDEYAGLGDMYDSSILLSSKNSYTDNTFADGTPFGIKEEE